MNKKLCKVMKKKGSWKPNLCDICTYSKKCKEKQLFEKEKNGQSK